ncbi:hypothetical protein ACQY0O_006255 [Thecaphora frezii]
MITPTPTDLAQPPLTYIDASPVPVVLTLIRHGETTANVARLLQGVADSPLTVHGQAQVQALAAAFATTLPSRQDGDGAERASTARPQPGPSRLDLPPPTLIVCSPVGRARKTAEAIYRACDGSTDAETLQSGPSAPARTSTLLASHGNGSGLRLWMDPGLAERDFGALESTRNHAHVAGFERGQGKGENRASFRARVQRVGKEYLEAAATLATGARNAVGSATPQPSPPSTQQRPHLVLVSHGMWIASFLAQHPPTAMDQVSDQPSYLALAANTGIFSLRVEASAPSEAGVRVRTTLVKSNDTQHLAHVKRQRGGIGRVAHDERQTKLQGFFQPAPKRRKTEASDGGGEVVDSAAAIRAQQPEAGPRRDYEWTAEMEAARHPTMAQQQR